MVESIPVREEGTTNEVTLKRYSVTVKVCLNDSPEER